MTYCRCGDDTHTPECDAEFAANLAKLRADQDEDDRD